MRILLGCLLSISCFSTSAALVDNHEMVNLYHKQKTASQEMLLNANNVMIASNRAFELILTNGEMATPQLLKINKAINYLREKSAQAYGEPLSKTPFMACRNLPLAVDLYWLAKQNTLRKGAPDNVQSQTDNFIKTSHDCEEEVANPPPEKTEELQIIDVTQ